jgi:hypothetical protein
MPRAGEMRNSYNIFVGSHEKKVPLVRDAGCENVDRMQLAQNSDLLRARQ